MIAFAKIFQNLFAPLPVFLFLFLVAFYLIARNKRQAQRLLLVSFLVFYILSNRLFANFLMTGLEGDHPSRPYTEYPTAEVLIVLGGSLTPYLQGRANLEENNGSRLVPAYLLYKAGKVKKIIVSGGNPYTRTDGVHRTEAEDMAEFLVSLGVPSTDIVEERTSRNTEENARDVSEILRKNHWEKILLLTSAFHIKRSLFYFRKYGVDATPVAVAHRGSIDYRFWYLCFIPSVNALDMTSQTIKEYFGLFWGMFKTSIKPPELTRTAAEKTSSLGSVLFFQIV